MSATTSAPARKTLADQIDRLDGILDGLADAIPEAVADAAREAVRRAVAEVLASPEVIARLREPCAPPAAAETRPEQVRSRPRTTPYFRPA